MSVQKPSLRRIGMALLGFFLLCWLLSPFVDHVLVWRAARNFANQAGAALAVTPLTDTSTLPLKTQTTISFQGWELAVPGVQTVSRTRGQTVAIFNVSHKEGIAFLGSPDESAPYRKSAVIRSLFTTAELSSGYAFVSAEMSASPDQISFWNSRRHNLRLMLLLLGKNSDTILGQAIHPINTLYVRGYEIEEQTSDGRLVTLLLFAKDGEGLKLLLNGRNLSQAWVNTVVSTLRPPLSQNLAPSTHNPSYVPTPDAAHSTPPAA